MSDTSKSDVAMCSSGQIAPIVRTSYVYPPIPIRSFDWQAWYDGEEDEQMATGHGATEQEAIDDLTENHPRDGQVVSRPHRQAPASGGDPA